MGTYSKYESQFEYTYSEYLAKKHGIIPGDQLKFAILIYGNMISHHGIYIGNGAVIHFHKDKPFTTPTVKQTSLMEFCADISKIERVLYPSAFEPQEVIRRAKELLNFGSEKMIYGLLSNNCEHIATYCKTGARTSYQAEQALEAARTVKVQVETANTKAIQGIEISSRIAKFYPVASRAFGWTIPVFKSILQALSYLR
jgi:hypothetical protein